MLPRKRIPGRRGAGSPLACLSALLSRLSLSCAGVLKRALQLPALSRGQPSGLRILPGPQTWPAKIRQQVPFPGSSPVFPLIMARVRCFFRRIPAHDARYMNSRRTRVREGSLQLCMSMVRAESVERIDARKYFGQKKAAGGGWILPRHFFAGPFRFPPRLPRIWDFGASSPGLAPSFAGHTGRSSGMPVFSAG